MTIKETDLPLVYIIILNWNGINDTLECLESVFKLKYENFKVVVIDNASTDNSVATIRKCYPNVILIENKENLGYTGGNNIGIQYAIKNNADYIWLLNNDTIVEKSSLIELVKIGEANSDIGLLNPIIYHYNEPTKIQVPKRYINWENFSFIEKKIVKTTNIEVNNNLILNGAALLIRKEVIKKIGHLREEYFAYWEDTEYSIRALKAGYLCAIVPSSKVYHKGGFLKLDCPIKDQRVYYSIRNKYFMFTSYLSRKNKIFYYFNFLADSIETATLIPNECIDALIDGIWNAYLRNGGSWEERKKMPRVLNRLFRKLISWHPFFWVNLFRGNFVEIFRLLIRRCFA